MKKIFITFLIITQSILFAQKLTFSFKLNENSLKKNNDLNPAGNSIEFIDFMGDTVWVATTIGVSKTGDNGTTWFNYEFGDEGISALAINNDTIWVATWHNKIIADNDTPVGSGLHYSADGGTNWVDIPQPIDSLSATTIKYGNNILRTSPWHTEVTNYTRAIAFTKGKIWIASFAGGLRVSSDVGKTWKKVVLPPDYLDEIKPSDSLSFDLSPTSAGKGYEENLNHRVFTICVVNDSTLYVGTADGINKSTDGGISWKKFNHQNQSEPMSGNFIIDMKYDYSRNTLWAATWKANGAKEFYGLSSTADGGETWQTFLSNENIHDIAFTFSPDGNEEDIIAATNNGIFRSQDLGVSWTIAPEMRDDQSNAKIGTNKFRAVNCLQDDNGKNNIWFGSDGNGSALLIETGNIWEGKWKVFLSSSSLTGEDEVYAFPNPFSPDNEVAKFKYSTKGKNAKVTIRVFDFGMNLIKTVLQNADRKLNSGDAPQDYWNGRDENNNIVPNGVYFYRIDVANEKPLFGKIIVLM